MSVSLRRAAALAVFGAAFALPRAASAQTSEFRACTLTTLETCAQINLSQQLGIGPGGLNLFSIALQNLGSSTQPLLPSALFYVMLNTGHDVAEPGTEVDALVTPQAAGGATLADASEWSLFDSGDAIFLSALSNFGIGGCAAGDPANGLGQMGQTCGPNETISFSFFTSRTYDMGAMSVADVEWGGLDANASNDSCIAGVNCAVTATPEPGTLLLAFTGLSGFLGAHRRRRQKSAAAMSEA